MTQSGSESKPRLPLAVWITALAAAPILAVMGASLLAVDQRLSPETDRTASADLSRVAPTVKQEMSVQGERLERLGAVIARDPKFFAVLTLPKADRKSPEFKAALERVLREFQRDAATPIFAVTDEQGTLLARALAPATGATDISGAKFVRDAISGKPGLGYMVENGVVYRVAAVPVTAGPSLVGTLCLGWSLDAALAERIHAATGCQVAFVAGDAVASTSIPPSPLRKLVAARVQDGNGSLAAKSGAGSAPDVWTSGGERYLTLRSTLKGPSAGGETGYVVLAPAGSGTTPYAVLRRDLLTAGGAGLVLALAAGALISAGVIRQRCRTEAAHDRDVERLEETDRVRAGFLATASREILAPTGNIGTYVELIADGALGDLSAPQREGLLAVRRSTESVARVGRDLANMSLIDRRELPVVLDHGDIGRLIEDVAVQVVPLASERRQRLSISVDADLTHPRIDADCLIQAVMNLAVNAIRHTPEGGSVEMGARRTNRGVEIFVSDTGTGISAEDLSRIHDRSTAGTDVTSGYRASTYRSPGLGLGLSVAFGIVEAHGGALRVESGPDHGSALTIDLPFPGAAPLTAVGSSNISPARRPGALEPQEALPLAS